MKKIKMDWLKRLWKKHFKVVMFFVSNKVVWTILLFAVFYFCTDMIFGNLLKHAIEKASNNTYEFNYKNFRYNFFTNKVIFKDAFLQSISTADTTQPIRSIHVDDIYLKGFGLYSFFVKKVIDFSDLTIKGTTAHINLNKDFSALNHPDSLSIVPSDSLSNDFSSRLKIFFKERSQQFGIEKFNFENASFYLHNTRDSLQDFAVENFNLKVEAIFINDSVLQHIDSAFFFKHFEFSFGKNNWNFQNDDRDWHVGFDSLYYSTKNKRTVAENLLVKNEKKAELIDVKASLLSIENLDFEKILNEEAINPDTLKISNSNINVTIVEKQEQKVDSSAFEKLLQKIYPISLKHIALEENNISLKFVRQNHPAIFFKSSINVYLDDFELDKATFNDKKSDLFSKYYSVHLSDLESSQQGSYQVSLKDLEWSTEQKDLVIYDLNYNNLASKELQSIQMHYFKLMKFEWEKWRQHQQLEAFALFAMDGSICLESQARPKTDAGKRSTSFTLPKNSWVSGIKFEHIEIDNIDFQNLNHLHRKTVDISNIDLDVDRLNVVQHKTYSLVDFDFCKKIALGTDDALLHVNDDFYQISWKQLNTDIDNVIKLKDVAISTTTSKEQLLKEAVILPSILVQANCHLLEINRFNIPLFVKYGILQVESIRTDSSEIALYKTAFSAKKSDFSMATAFVESILLDRGNFIYEDDHSHLKINQYQLNVDFLNISDFNDISHSMKFNDFVFQYASQEYKDKKLSLATKQLKLDHLKERFNIGNISLQMQSENSQLQDLSVDIQQLLLTHFDYRALIFDRVLYAKSLSTKSTAIEGALDFHYSKVDSVKKGLPLQQVLIRNVAMQDISTHFTMTDTLQENYSLDFRKSYLKAQNVNWMPDMVGFPHHGKLEVGVRNLKAGTVQLQKAVTVDSLIFSLLPNQIQIYNIAYRDEKQGAVCPSAELHDISVLDPIMDSIVIAKKFISEKLLIHGGDIVLDLNNLSHSDTLPKVRDSLPMRPKLEKTNSIINDIFKQVSFSDIHLKILQKDRAQWVDLDNGVMDKEHGHTITIGDMNFLVNHDIVNMGFKNVLISSKFKRIIVDSCYYTPTLSKEEWGKHFGYQNDWTKFSIKSILFEDVLLDDLINQDVHRIPFVRIHQLALEDYRDKRLPFPENRYPGMPQDMLRKVIRPFLIDSLVVTSSMFSYEEHVPYALYPGKINFTRALVSASNITNAEEYITDPMLINASMMLMDTTKLTVQLSFDLNDSLNNFEASAQLEPINMPLLNPVLENLAFLTIKDGYSNSLSMDFHGNKNYALGSMLFKYENFKIGLIDKKKLHPSAGSNLLAFLANTFIVRRSNPTTVFPRTGIMYFEPDPHKSIFNYLFKTALSGIKHTIGLREQKAKDKGSESYSVYTQERKELIKAHKNQKKLEKKLNRKGVGSNNGKKIK